VRTDDPLYPEVRMPFTILRRASGVTAVPAQVSLVGSRAALPSRVIQLGSADETPVEVAGVECGHPALSCRWASGPGPRSTLRLQIDGSRIAGGELNSEIRIRLSRPAGQTITVPVRCSV